MRAGNLQRTCAAPGSRVSRAAFAALAALILTGADPLRADDPPDSVSYQGVLRDAAGNPRNGNFDMVFRFFDQPTAGSEILIDRHLAAGAGAVAVTSGLFKVPLGSGAVSDGAAVLPGDPYTSLPRMFADFGDVWMQIEVGTGGAFEVLLPRLKIDAVPYAHLASRANVAGTAENAASLAGIPAGSFLNTSSTDQTKVGSLTASNMTANATLRAGGRLLEMGSPGAVLSSDNSGLYLLGGDASSDYIFLRANLDPETSSIMLADTGPIQFTSGGDGFVFDEWGSTTSTSIGNIGVSTTGILTAEGGGIRLGGPGNILKTLDYGPLGLNISGFDEPTDRILLISGTGLNSSRISLNGNSDLAFNSSTGDFSFTRGPGTMVASLSPDGTLTAVNDLVASGNELRFGFPMARLTASTSSLTVAAGDADSDDLMLLGGNELTDGSILILGDQEMILRAGNGSFQFAHGATGVLTAEIDATGAVKSVGDLVAGSGVVHLSTTGALILGHATGMILGAGDLDTDDLRLESGNDFTDGSIDIQGEGTMTLRSGNGTVTFTNGATGANVATLGGTGSLNVGEDLIAGRDVIVGGYEVHLGAPGSTRIVRNPATDDFYIARDEDQNHLNSTFSIFTNIGVQQMRIGDGDEADALFDDQVVTNGIDYAEAFWITDASLEAGEVVLFDPERPGYIVRSAEAYSNRAAGVISTRPGFLTGGSFDAEEAADPALAEEMKRAYTVKDYAAAKEIGLVLEQKKKEQQRPVALVGRLPVKVDGSYGAITAGDHLTSSPTPGHAMRMDAPGPSIGIALEGFAGKGRGTILAFVQRGHYTPTSLLTETQAAQARLAETVAARTPEPATGVQVMPADLQLVLDASGAEEARLSVFRDGEAAEPRSEVFRVDERGNVWAQGAFRPRSMDVAEAFRVSEPVEPGDVLVVDRLHPGLYAKSREAADRAVVGVVASEPGVFLGGDVSRLLAESPDLAEALGEARRSRDRKAERATWDEIERRFRAGHAAVALTGTVTVKADASHGAIAAGDLLIASPTPGHAMRADDAVPMGAVFGKALEPLADGAGAIRMLVMMR